MPIQFPGDDYQRGSLADNPRAIVSSPLLVEMARRIHFSQEWERLLLCKKTALAFMKGKGFTKHTRAVQRRFCRWVTVKANKLADQGVEPEYER